MTENSRNDLNIGSKIKVHKEVPYTIQKGWHSRMGDVFLNKTGTVVSFHPHISEAVRIRAKIDNEYKERFFHYKDLKKLEIIRKSTSVTFNPKELEI
jgi:hypothetical protein